MRVVGGAAAPSGSDRGDASKVELLRSLSIEREAGHTPAPSRGGGRPLLIAAAVLLIGGGAGVAAWQWGDLTGVGADGDTAPLSAAAPPDTTDGSGTRGSGTPSGGGSAPQALPATALAQTRPAGNLVASGYVVARRLATVSAEVFGRIDKVLVEEGQVVKAGQVLAVLDTSLVDVDLALAKARVPLEEAQRASIMADLREAERVFARNRQLTARDFASEAALTQAEARVETLRAQLAAATAAVEVTRLQVRLQEEQLEKRTIRAPFDGVVVDKNAQEGEIIAPNAAGGGFARTGICTIVDTDSLEIEVDVNEAFIGRVRPGQKAQAVLDAYPDRIIPAEVIAIVPTAQRDKATITVRVGLLEKDPKRILRDMAAKVTFLEADS